MKRICSISLIVALLLSMITISFTQSVALEVPVKAGDNTKTITNTDITNTDITGTDITGTDITVEEISGILQQLPILRNITLNHTAQVEALYAAYQGLSQSQQQQLTQEQTDFIVGAYYKVCRLNMDGWFGDIDGNNIINSADARKVLQQCVGLTTLSLREFLLADVDGDNVLTPKDAIYIVNYAVGRVSVLPVEKLLSDPTVDLTPAPFTQYEEVSLQVSSADGFQGETVTLTVSLEGNTQRIGGFACEFQYNHEQLELQDISSSLIGATIEKNPLTDGFAFLESNGFSVEVANEIAVLTFLVKQPITEPSPVTLSVTHIEDLYLKYGYNVTVNDGGVMPSPSVGIIHLIEELPAIEEITLEHEQKVLAVWNAYQALSQKHKNQVHNLSDLVAAKGQLLWLAQQQQAPTVTPTAVFMVDSARGTVGSEVTVAVTVENNPGIVSAKLNLYYDARCLEVVALNQGDFEGVFFSPVSGKPLVINWADGLHPNNSQDGVLAYITFRLKDEMTATTALLSLEYDPEDVFDADFNNVPFKVENGAITLGERIMGDLNGDGKINNKDLSALQRFLCYWGNVIDQTAADVNADGVINNKDFSLLQRYINGWDVAFG